MGAGNPVAGSLAGLAWLIWIVRQAKPSSYTTLYGLGTLFTMNGPFPRGASLLVRSGGVVSTKMRLPTLYGLVAAGAGGGAICWWVIESCCLSASTYTAGSSRDGEAQALLSRSGGSVGSLPVAIMEAEKPWGSWTMAFKANMMPRILSTQVREGVPSSKRAWSILLMVRWLCSLMEFPSGW